MNVSIAEMRGQLVELDEVMDAMATAEPVVGLPFAVSDDNAGSLGRARVRFEPVDNTSQLVAQGSMPDDSNTIFEFGGDDYRMTNEGLLHLTSSLGITKKYAAKVDGEMLVDHVNWWLNGNQSGYATALQSLIVGGDHVGAVTKETTTPFSNLSLVSGVVERLRAEYGQDSDIAVDYKWSHSLERTNVRLIVCDGPSYAPRAGDEWALGLDYQNSLTGKSGVSTSLGAYLFRWWCTNGMTSTHANLGTWNRRTGGQDVSEVREWMAEGVSEILLAAVPEFEALEVMANASIEGEVAYALEDVFETYRLPDGVRRAIMDNMVNSDDLTLYGVHAAVTQAANDPDMSEGQRASLLSVGGDLIHASRDRCETCNRLPVDH